MTEELVEYKTYKDKAVMMFCTTCPELLHKRDRGRPTEATIDPKRKEFGETDAMLHHEISTFTAMIFSL